MNTKNIINEQQLKEMWLREQELAFINGWDFSHVDGRMVEEHDFPWDYRKLVETYVTPKNCILDIDPGGGEFLLSLNYPAELISATEGYAPNVELCKERLIPMGIDFKEATDYSNLPFESGQFDVVLNRHGAYDVAELYRILRKGGIFITQQVGENNERDLVEMVLPGLEKTYKEKNLMDQKKVFEHNGFEILESGECYSPIRFYDVGAFVWFARVIQWEFKGFDVDTCFDKLLDMHEQIIKNGYVQGTTHRYMLVARKI